ncbi:multi-sensor signal transduction histidine kinase [Ancylobacter novellus DSM 506]|uniref:histidine kinase n=1 Tax=Ancylobacter novellus (strain ATCC 8093 / DSM 506 / JCM 20403 / CCM 1077 / IAM 12100 / NBRC 12443 / NCIMB 10456) TaxID=639283 RepID=D6ZYQ7_ANCN5|nr:multi-sensor signal transduction histidine kinase [Ancylobacter novellus DSM 506]
MFISRGVILDDTPSSRWFMPVIAAALAAAIFIIDTFSALDMAIAVLYVVVVLLSANYSDRKGLLAIAGLCVGLTVLSFLIMHGSDYDLSSTMRALVSIAAVTVTTLLCLENQAATQSLRAQADLLDLTHDAIFVRDIADTVQYWSKGAEELYGWTSDQAVGLKAAELLKTEFPGPLADIRAELFRTGRWEGELVHTKQDGTKVVVMSRWSLQRDERGRPLAAMETNSDITERKHAEDTLHQTQAELAHVTRVATMGELTASIAHEINQPLAAVVTNGEAGLRWLGRPEPDIAEVKASVERMIANGRRASEVVARLRALARRGEPIQAPVDVNEMIDEVLPLVERERSDHRVTLDLALAQQLPVVLGDRVQLQQVALNLALNAIQAMAGVNERHRRLWITTRMGSSEEGDAVLIEVRDNGPGVDPDSLAKLFNAFYSTKKDGMGMGLSISRSIIEAHGGKILATLHVEGGMLFTVMLPVPKERLS